MRCLRKTGFNAAVFVNQGIKVDGTRSFHFVEQPLNLQIGNVRIKGREAYQLNYNGVQ